MNQVHVLVVEDEPNIRDSLRFNLSREGYRVTEAASGGAGLRLAQTTDPDLILMDLMLPEMSGFELCRIIRRTSAVPIIMLTAKDQEPDKVLGLGLGADDYITKPFSLQELFARISAVLRRTHPPDRPPAADDNSIQEVGSLTIDRDARRVMMKGREIRLSKKEFDLLAYLLAHPGKVFTRDQLIQHVWEYNFVGDRKTVDVHIRWLRQKLEHQAELTITTVRGVGYRLDPAGEVASASPG